MPRFTNATLPRAVRWLVAVGLVAGCQQDFSVSRKEDPVEETYPLIEVEPLEIDFGLRRADEPQTRTVTLTNTGFALLDVSAISFAGGPSFTFTSADDPTADQPLVLDRGESYTVDVDFAPVEAGLLEGQVTIESNALNDQTVRVDVFAEGAVPDLVISPDPLAYGEQYIPCDTERPVVLENVGTEVLTITDIRFDGAADFLDFGVAIPDTFDLPPGTNWTLPITFTPLEPQDDFFSAQLVVTSNDLAGDEAIEVTGRGRYVQEYTDTFIAPDEYPVDILFAVDQSCSMDSEATLLGTEFSRFIGALGTATQDWKIGVVTRDSGCFNSGILRSTTPGVGSVFASAVTQGSDGDGTTSLTEKLFSLVEVALAKDSPSQCNWGFVERDEPLHIIFVSDEEEQSTRSWSQYLTMYQTDMRFTTRYASGITVHAIADLNRACGDGTGSDGYRQMANATGGELLNICSPGWAQDLEDIANSAITDLAVFELTHSGPDPASIVVRVNGTEWTTDWRYDPTRNAIVFDVLPPDGASIEVDYGVTPICP